MLCSLSLSIYFITQSLFPSVYLSLPLYVTLCLFLLLLFISLSFLSISLSVFLLSRCNQAAAGGEASTFLLLCLLLCLHLWVSLCISLSLSLSFFLSHSPYFVCRLLSASLTLFYLVLSLSLFHCLSVCLPISFFNSTLGRGCVNISLSLVQLLPTLGRSWYNDGGHGTRENLPAVQGISLLCPITSYSRPWLV